MPNEPEASDLSLTVANVVNPLPEAVAKPETSVVVDGFREKVYLALTVAILSFAGAALGTFMTSRLDEAKWRRETSFGVKREIFAKRMELIERTIKAFNQLQVLDLYQGTDRYLSLEGEDLIRSGKSAVPTLNARLATVVRAKDAQAELSSVMTLDALYFGPKTRDSIRELDKGLRSSDKWWKVDPAKTQAVLDAAASELHSGID